MILFAIEGKRADILKTIGVNDLIVIVLNPEVLPNDDARSTFNQKRYRAASEVAAFRADAERCSTVGHVRRALSQESGDARYLFISIAPAERRDEIGINP